MILDREDGQLGGSATKEPAAAVFSNQYLEFRKPLARD